MLIGHTLVPDLRGLAPHIGKPETVIDVGPGIRPATWANAKRHICIEPCHLYAEILRGKGYEVIEARAADGLRQCSGDLVLMLDCIEHMERDEATEVLVAAYEAAPRIIVYTPNGFLEQTTDAWGLGQHDWQKHRSGWTPADFTGWTIVEGKEGFAAIYGDV